MARKEVVSHATTAIASIAVILGGIYFLEDRFAKATELKTINGVLQYHLLDVRFTSIRDRLWQLKKRHGEDCIKKEKDCKEASDELDNIKRLMVRAK